MQKAVLLILAAAFCIAMGIWGANNRSNKKNDLRKNGVLLNCRIVDATLFDKHSDYKVEFYYKGIKRTGNSKSAIGSTTYFIDQYFPLLFSPQSEAIQVLIVPDDFSEFGIEFPDSLNWVLKYKNK